MPKVLTTQARVTCNHQGTVQVSSAGQSILKVDGVSVLVDGDLVGEPVTGCTNQPTPATPSLKPCTTTSSMLVGASTKLKAGNKAVLLDSANGVTDSTPPGAWSVQSAGQTKLESP
jgi:hypothetical protein